MGGAPSMRSSATSSPPESTTATVTFSPRLSALACARSIDSWASASVSDIAQFSHGAPIAALFARLARLLVIGWRRTDFRACAAPPVALTLCNGPEGNVRGGGNGPQGHVPALERRSVGVISYSGASGGGSSR